MDWVRDGRVTLQRVLGAVAVSLAVGLGCGDSNDPVSADAGRPAPDGGLVVASDASMEDDPDAGSFPTVAIPPLRSWAEEGWLIASVAPNADPYARPFLERAMTRPVVGEDPMSGTTWQEGGPNDDGEISVAGEAIVYAALPLELDAPLRLSLRFHNLEVLVDERALHAPDPYRTLRVRMPVYVPEGSHTLFVRGRARRGPPRVLIEVAESPVAPNLSDVTRPDLVPGEELEAPLGVHVLNLSGALLDDLRTHVLEHPWFEATARDQAPLARDAAGPVIFDLVAKGPIPSGTDTATLTLGLETGGVIHTFELPLPVLVEGRSIRRTFVSAIDRSVQYYAENGPGASPSEPAAMVLSLHGAGVEAEGQARAYDQKDWAHIIAPTNRRPFGFDWQDWGRLDALEALAHARSRLPHDTERIHVTGHSMGGHGTWHLGYLYPDLFATVGPSAGWPSFSSYGGTSSLPSSWEPARLHDETVPYKGNFAGRTVYMIHGTADDNVPVTLSRLMRAELDGIPAVLELHEEPGAGHWWDGDPAPGARCVDFPPLFDLIRADRRTLLELDFTFESPAPWVSPSRSYASVDAVLDPFQPFRLESVRQGGTVRLITTNVAALHLDGASLRAAGIADIEVNGEPRPVEAGEMRIGASSKRPGRHGPIKEALFAPFCFIHPDGDAFSEATAAYMTSVWAMIGNGAACTLPFARRAEAGDRNRIYLQVPSAMLDVPEGIPFSFGSDEVRIGGQAITAPTFLGFVYPEEDRLAVSLFGTDSARWMVAFFSPFSSRGAYPDWFTFVLNPAGNPAYGPAGWFDADWRYDPSLSAPRLP